MNKLVGVLLGGHSRERAGSLVTGSTAIEALRRLGYNTTAIDPIEAGLIDKLRSVDFVFIALHGRYGEDGKIQGLLDSLQIPYTGSGVLASAIGMNKVAFKKMLLAEQIPTPRFAIMQHGQYDSLANTVVKELQFPVIVKPIQEGGSLGVHVVRTADELYTAIADAHTEFGDLIVEEYVVGDFLTVGALGHYHSPIVLPVMLVRFDGDIYDYQIKHTPGLALCEAPAMIAPPIYAMAQEYTRRIYITLGCHGPLRVDMMCDSSGQLFVIEVNTVPGLSPNGNLPAIAAAADITYDELIDAICVSALNKPRYLP